mgnify:FL=1
MEVSIRRLRLNEVEKLEELYQEYMRIDESRHATIRESLGDEDSEIMVAEADGKLVGVSHQVFYEDPLHAGKCSNILFLYVTESFRRQGIGRSLLATAVKSARERGVLEVHVSTRADNKTAIKMYEEFGFECAGPLFECTPSGLEDTIHGEAGA